MPASASAGHVWRFHRMGRCVCPGIPSNPPRVEKLTDPKSVLENAFKATNPSKRRARAGAAALMDALGDRVAIEKLRLVPSFQKLDLELLHALRQIQVCP